MMGDFATKNEGKNFPKCAETQCAWWVIYYRGQQKEYGECCIKALSYLVDVLLINIIKHVNR